MEKGKLLLLYFPKIHSNFQEYTVVNRKYFCEKSRTHHFDRFWQTYIFQQNYLLIPFRNHQKRYVSVINDYENYTNP